MQLYHILRKIGLINYTEEEIDDYYISKRIVKKYKKEYLKMITSKESNVTKEESEEISKFIQTLLYILFIQESIIGLYSKNRDEKISSIFALDGTGSLREIKFLQELVESSDDEIKTLAKKAIKSIEKRAESKIDYPPVENPQEVLARLVKRYPEYKSLIEKGLKELLRLRPIPSLNEAAKGTT